MASTNREVHSREALRRLISACLAFCSLSAVSPAAGEPDSHWKDWRNRRRAELAALPKPAVPASSEEQVIDRFLFAYWTKNKIARPTVAEDRIYARRVYLDVTGLLPTIEQLDRFVADRNPRKREKLVDSLLSDRDAYAEHWMTFWNDLLRNDEQTNIDGLRKPITGWLYASLRHNKPLDLFVTELLDPGPDGPDGYLKGVNWRGQVNASQTPPIQAAQNVSQVFLASSLKCASCHDSFINDLKLVQAYGLASFFSDKNLEMHRCDKATGKIVAPKFLYPGLGEIAPNADLKARHRAVSEMVTRPDNPRFAKTMVNRLWKRLLGRGLFEPIDDYDGNLSNRELLEWLAYDFMIHDYDVKHTLRQILLSRVYQAPVSQSQPVKAKELTPLKGPVARKMSSEQYLDAISQVTEYWPKTDVMKVNVANPHVRAWLHKKPDALAVALGRPTREQVCTERSQESTVLQALELVNGSVLANQLEGGAKSLLGTKLGQEKNPETVLSTIYKRALGRLPTAEEASLLRSLVGSVQDSREQRQKGWEDLLWVLVMTPEFQFIE
jgi:hypothetical protein